MTNFYMLATYKNQNSVEIGVDEAGYGAFYGRVYAAAVIWPHDFNHELIKDSKKLSPKQRDRAYQIVLDNAIAYGVAHREAYEIDNTNIRVANIQAMHEAIDRCRVLADTILVDGIAFEPYLDKKFELVEHDLIKKGDSTIAAIAAASILAKVTRDRWILEECQRNPDLVEHYHLDKNKGYGAEIHREGLARYGWTIGHRKRGFSEKYVKK